MNAATHHGLPRENPTTVITASSQKMLPERISGRQNSHRPMASGVGRGRPSQTTPAAAAPTSSAQKAGHGRSVSGQTTCAKRGL